MEEWLQRFQHRWLDRIQSRIVLPTARTLYLVVCGFCVVLVALGLAAALLFQAASLRTARQDPLPPVPEERPAAIDYATLDRRLMPPSGVRFERQSELPTEIADQTVLGFVKADSPNGGISFQLVGGRDADAVDLGDDGALRAKEPLAGRINAAVQARGAASQPFELKVLARDRFENRARPATLEFNIVFGRAAAATATIEDGTPADLIAIARQLALVVAQPGTPEYVEAFNYAKGEPTRCAAAGDQQFILDYSLAVHHALSRLTPSSLEPFYHGVCDAWEEAVAKGQRVTRQALAERLRTATDNSVRQAEVAAGKLVTRGLRNLALLFVAIAVVSFMIVALFLAFLAIEGHSSAMREAIEVMVRLQGGDGAPARKETAE